MKTELGHGPNGFGARHRTADQHADFYAGIQPQAAGDGRIVLDANIVRLSNMLLWAWSRENTGRVVRAPLLFRRARVLLSGSTTYFTDAVLAHFGASREDL